MKKRCPYCGQMIQTTAQECEHCGKSLEGKQDTNNRKVGIEKWEKGVPSWLMGIVIVGGLFLVALMIYQGCQRISEPPEQDPPAAPASLP